MPSRKALSQILEGLERDEIATIKNLLTSGWNPNAPIGDGSLLTLISKVESAELLVRAGAEIDGGKNGWAPILIHSACSHPEVVRFLISRGANVNISYRRGDRADVPIGTTSLMKAASRGDFDIVNLLLKAKADVNASDECGHQALFHALRYDQNKIAKILISRGARLCKDVLCPAIARGNLEMVRLLISKGAEVNHVFQKLNNDHYWPVGKTLLGYAIGNADRNGYSKKIAECLIRAGADVNQPSPWHELRRSAGKENGRDIMASPVRIAAERQQEGIMKLLWKFGAKATLREAVAGSTVERAVWYDLRVTMKLLIQSGADVNTPGRESGKRPLDLAKEKRHLEIISMLEKAGAR